MEEKIKDLQEKVNILLARQAQLEGEIEKLKSQSFSTGVVLDGCSTRNAYYVNKALYGNKGDINAK